MTVLLNEALIDEVKTGIIEKRHQSLKRLKIDPALATGPLVSTSNDIISLLIYLASVTFFFKLTA